MKLSCICCGLFAKTKDHDGEQEILCRDEGQKKLVESFLARKKITKNREEKEKLLFAEEMSPLAGRSEIQSPLQIPRIR